MTKAFQSCFQIHLRLFATVSLAIMVVEYSGGGVLIFSYLILIHQRYTFGGLYDNQVESRQLDTSEFIGCCFDGQPIACKRGLRVAS